MKALCGLLIALTALLWWASFRTYYDIGEGVAFALSIAGVCTFYSAIAAWEDR